MGWLRHLLPAVALIVGCQRESSWSGEIAVADQTLFASEVYPVLLADCAFSQCHGANQRFFQVFGPGRTRLKDSAGADSLPLEMQVSYARALSMLITDGSRPLSESLLLLKPLDSAAGGTGHGGVDVYGRNVYRSASDPNYLVLQRWALTAQVPQPVAVAPPAAGSGSVPIAGQSALGPSAGGGALVPTMHPTMDSAATTITAGAGATQAPVGTNASANVLPGVRP
jgi:hypothetical protein